MTGEERAPRKTKLIVIALVVSLIASTLVLGGAIYIKSKQENELKQALIENCEKSPVREALTEVLQEEINESHTPLIDRFSKALDVTPQELHALIETKDAKKQERIGQIEPSDCEAQYNK